MTLNRDQLKIELGKLDGTIAVLMTNFWIALAEASDFASQCESAADVDWLNGQINDLLRKHGVAVPKNELSFDDRNA